MNDCLHVRPSLNPLFYSILLRFRENRIALVGDIEKAFLNVEVDEADRYCLRFLWVSNVKGDNAETLVYGFCRVVFGFNASPFLLNATLRHHVLKFTEIDPKFVQKVLEMILLVVRVTQRKRLTCLIRLRVGWLKVGLI